MSYLRDLAVVLRVVPYREHDAWITMYGKTHGKLTAVARGLRRPDAKQAGHLLPFACIEVMIAKGSAFDKLAVARAIKPNAAEGNLPALALLGGFSDLLDRLTKPGLPDVGLFDLWMDLERTVISCREAVSTDRLLLIHGAVVLKLLDRLGYGPEETMHNETQRKLLRFMRHSPLEDLLRVTADPRHFRAVVHYALEASRQAPLEREPHAAKTILGLLTPLF
jgi:DNA repair protein RecO